MGTGRFYSSKKEKVPEVIILQLGDTERNGAIGSIGQYVFI
jgi:hypothetical protein